MINVVRASFNIDTTAPPEDDLIAYARRIFNKMDAAAEELLSFDDYSLYLSVEEGSVKGLAKVAIIASTFINFIANYGSVIQGLETMERHGRALGRAIVAAASDDKMIQNAPRVNSRVEASAATRLKQLFVKVRDREIAPEDAAHRIMQALASTGDKLAPEDLRKLEAALESVQLNPEQLSLDLGAEEESIPPSAPAPPRNRHIPTLPHLLVVIEREEKSSQPRLRKEYR